MTNRADTGMSIRQSDREHYLASHASTFGRDKSLSEQQIVTWSVLENIPVIVFEREAWIEQLKEDLGDLVQLEPGWDSYGATQIASEAVARTSEVLDVLARVHAPRPSLVPTNAGGIQIEWFGKGIELQLEIEPPFEALNLYYRDEGTGAWWHGPIGEEPEPLEKLLWHLGNGG